MVKYKIIADQLSEAIRQGKYKDTNKLPTEEQLVKEFNVSKTTIRNAIQVLCSYGIVYQVQGSGMFIRERDKDDYLTLTLQRGVKTRYMDKSVESLCLSLEVIEADEKLAKTMKCALNTPIYFIKRLRIVEHEYYSIEYTYYNKEVIPYLNETIVEDSIYKYIKDVLKLNVAFADKYVYCEKLNKEDAELLHLQENDPALIINDITYLSSGVIFNYSRVVHNYQKVKIYSTASNV